MILGLVYGVSITDGWTYALMHRTLKEDTAKPPAGTLTVQQKKFDRFRFTFNHERPHEALDNETPGSVYVPSARMLPSSVVSFQ